MHVIDDRRATELLELATQRATEGDPRTAAGLAAEAAELLPRHDPDRHDAFVLAAQLLHRAGRYAAAADAWASAARESGDDVTRARDLTGEGESARLAGAWPRAIGSHQRALLLSEALTGESVNTAVIAQNLAMTFKYTGRFDEAERLYRRALDIADATDEQRLVAAICHNLGGLAHARQRHVTGISWARCGIAVRERLTDPDPLGLAADHGALAGLLIDAGELDEAHALLLDARTTFVDHLGPDHYEVGVVDGNLAAIALERGDLPEAERRARRALTVKERSLGLSNPELAVTLTTLGVIRHRRGDAIEAVRLHGRALEILRPVVEADHPLLLAIEENLGSALSEPAPPARHRRGW